MDELVWPLCGNNGSAARHASRVASGAAFGLPKSSDRHG
jgi:hypothetical protein